MSETNPSNPQFIGQADARVKNAGEGLPKDEVVLTAEQKQVVEVMESAGKKLEGAELDARENAAGQLKKLQGKELVDAGLKQMGHGVWETVKSEAKGLIGGGVLGGITGGVSLAALGGIADRTVESVALGAASGVVAGSALGAIAGGALGYETAGIAYNRNIVRRENLPPARWYDWVISHGSGALINLLVGRVARNPVTAARASFVLGQLINPISAGGMRNVATGLWQMKKG